MKKRLQEREQKIEQIKEISEGLLASAVDAAIFLTVYTLMPGPYTKTTARTYRIMNKVNYFTIKTALYNAAKKGYLRRQNKEWVATAAGRKRLAALLPEYKQERNWNGKIYLITYDISEKKKRDRELLRHYLQKLGAIKLQESVYLTPYDLRETLADFVNERKLNAEIIVSTIGKDGAVGDDNLEDLLVRVYHLEKLNDRYRNFIKVYEKAKNFDREQMIFAYESILQDDPQLPFSLEPAWFLGKQAFKIYQEKLQDV